MTNRLSGSSESVCDYVAVTVSETEMEKTTVKSDHLFSVKEEAGIEMKTPLADAEIPFLQTPEMSQTAILVDQAQPANPKGSRPWNSVTETVANIPKTNVVCYTKNEAAEYHESDWFNLTSSPKHVARQSSECLIPADSVNSLSEGCEGEDASCRRRPLVSIISVFKLCVVFLLLMIVGASAYVALDVQSGHVSIFYMSTKFFIASVKEITFFCLVDVLVLFCFSDK